MKLCLNLSLQEMSITGIFAQVVTDFTYVSILFGIMFEEPFVFDIVISYFPSTKFKIYPSKLRLVLFCSVFPILAC